MAQARNSWLFPYRPFDVTAFLQAIGSPRLEDTPQFAGWVKQAALANDLRCEWLLMLAEKEQSFLTRRKGFFGWERACAYTLGYGATDSHDLPAYAGTERQILSAAIGLRKYLTPGSSLYVGGMVGRKFTDPHQEAYTPANLAEAALLQYTPWVYALRDAVAIYTRYWPEEAESMAHGFASLHPRQVDVLQELGITDGQVTQGWGGAPASAGYHRPESAYPQCHAYSSCVDLARDCVDRAMYDRLVAALWCPFVREPPQWSGSQHVHCVTVGLRGYDGKPHILAGPRMQIIDFTRGLNGLVGHAPLPAKWMPSIAQGEAISEAYAAWAPGVATAVIAPEGNRLPCYAFLEGDAVRCEARAFLLYWGALVTWHTDHMEASYKGQALDLSTCNLRVEGQFTRADVRPLAQLLGLKVRFNWAENELSADVQLEY
jgi:hypothetical protein